MKRVILGFLILIGLMFCVAPDAYSATAPEIVTAGDPDIILAIAQKLGTAELTTDRDGDPKISGKLKGTAYSLLFYGCKENKNCKDILFITYWSGYTCSLESVTKWSWERGKFAKATLDSDNDPCLKMAVNINKGVTVDNLRDTFVWWVALVEDFEKKVLNAEK